MIPGNTFFYQTEVVAHGWTSVIGHGHMDDGTRAYPFKDERACFVFEYIKACMGDPLYLF